MVGLIISWLKPRWPFKLRSHPGSGAVICADAFINTVTLVYALLSAPDPRFSLRVRVCVQPWSMADGPDSDEPPSVRFPPLITVSDLPASTPAGERVCTSRDPPSVICHPDADERRCSNRTSDIFKKVFLYSNRVYWGSNQPTYLVK